MYSFFDEDLDHLTECNLDSLDEACNTAILDIDNLTIVDSLPTSEETGEPCHMSLLSIHADDSRADYEKPFFLNTTGFAVIVEGGSLYNQTWEIK